jgi:predicted ATPase
VFFDRGLIDAAANLQFMGEPVLTTLGHLTVTIGECF